MSPLLSVEFPVPTNDDLGFKNPDHTLELARGLVGDLLQSLNPAWPDRGGGNTLKYRYLLAKDKDFYVFIQRRLATNSDDIENGREDELDDEPDHGT
jgi:hypothetical protein